MEIKQFVVIEEVLVKAKSFIFGLPSDSSRIKQLKIEEFDKALSALASLNAMLEEEGEDEKDLRDFFEREIGICESNLTLKVGNLENRQRNLGGAKRLYTAFSRFALRAQLNEAKLVEAKREALEELKQKFLTRKNYANTWAVFEIDQQLAALRAGKEEDGKR